MGAPNSKSEQWLWQNPHWPNFKWHEEPLAPLLRQAYDLLGQLKGYMAWADDSEEFSLNAMLNNIVASSFIENEQVVVSEVRSSLAKQLGINDKTPIKTTEKSEGLALLMHDAVVNWQQPISQNLLLKWHRWLFQAQSSIFHYIEPGTFRGNTPMQVVSGPINNPKIHFEAPPKKILAQEVNTFIKWFNGSLKKDLDPLLRAGITHLWLVTLHPFEDGNGRITRALTDRALAQYDQQGIRFFAMSEAILERRNGYYKILEATQRNGLDITPWLSWFIHTLNLSIKKALAKIERVLYKTKYWAQHANKELLEPQRKTLNRMLDGDFELGINASKYQSLTKVSKATATRHLSALAELGMLVKQPAGGRSTRYKLPSD